MSIEGVKIRDFVGHSQAVYALCKDQLDGSIYSSGGDGMLVRWQMDQTDGTLIARLDGAVYAVCAIRDYVLTGTQKGVLNVFDKKKISTKQIQISSSPIFEILEWNERILVFCGNGTLVILNSEFEHERQIKLSEKSLRSCCMTTDGIAIGCSDGNIICLNSEFEKTYVFKLHQETVFSLAYDVQSQTLISGGKDALLIFSSKGQEIRSLPAHLLHIHSLAINSENDFLLSASMDKTIKVWDKKTGKLLKVINSEKYETHRSSVNKILWFDKNNFISCSDDRTLLCFEIREQK